ncbi:MAG: hypothetical protein Q4C34_07595 [Bacteroidales bacterium]|nr:hypothetical protein [Bacteroidales bacterium]
MKKAAHILTAMLVMASTLFTSCNSDEPTPTTEVFGTFVTYEGATELSKDWNLTFTTREENDSPLVTFTWSSKAEPDKNLVKGERYLITYTNASQQRYASGSITLMQILQIFNGKVTPKPLSEIKDMQKDPYRILLTERSGQWVNLIGVAPFNVLPKTFCLFVDEATINSSIPDVYVGYVSDTNSATISDKELYGSFDLAPVWNLPTCKGIKLHYSTTSGETSKTFLRNNGPLTPTPDPGE